MVNAEIAPLRIVITGTRQWNDKTTIMKAITEAVRLHFFGDNKVSRKDIESMFSKTTIVHGGARGADRIAGSWAESVGMKTEVFYADWDTHGKKAGHIRNTEMVRSSPKPNYCIAFFADDYDSRGTAGCVREAKKARIPTVEISGPVWGDREARMNGIETG